jgi:hypothetical protein
MCSRSSHIVLKNLIVMVCLASFSHLYVRPNNPERRMLAKYSLEGPKLEFDPSRGIVSTHPSHDLSFVWDTMTTLDKKMCPTWSARGAEWR